MNSSETVTKWLAWARELQALGQTGLHFAQGPYDQERYARIQEIGAEIIARQSNLLPDQILQFNTAEFGYATPKVDVRGVVFRQEQILLVRETADQGRWTLPGGWADVNESPAEAVQREVREESGFAVVARRLIAAYDREKQGHSPPFPYHVYKLFFLCEIVAVETPSGSETSEVGFFPKDPLPELSLSRVTPHQIHRLFAFLRDPDKPAEFD